MYLFQMSLLYAWMVPLSEGNYRPSTKPCNLTQMTLDELYNKSHKKVHVEQMPRKCLNWTKTLV
jgi:hypothetical protein